MSNLILLHVERRATWPLCLPRWDLRMVECKDDYDSHHDSSPHRKWGSILTCLSFPMSPSRWVIARLCGQVYGQEGSMCSHHFGSHNHRAEGSFLVRKLSGCRVLRAETLRRDFWCGETQGHGSPQGKEEERPLKDEDTHTGDKEKEETTVTRCKNTEEIWGREKQEQDTQEVGETRERYGFPFSKWKGAVLQGLCKLVSGASMLPQGRGRSQKRALKWF